LHSASPAFTIAFFCLLAAQSRTQEQEMLESIVLLFYSLRSAAG